MARFFWSLVTPQQAIAGLEISDTHVRIVLLESPTKKRPFIGVRAQAEITLADSIVKNGIVQNEKKLTEAIQSVRTATKAAIRYVILSIPADQIYTEVLSFPKSIRPEKLDEAINLATHLELPFAFEEAYVDSEQRDGKDKREALITAARKKTIQAYIQAIEATGLRVVAVEHHTVSAIRALNIEAEHDYLFAIPGNTSLTLSLARGPHLAMIRTEYGGSKNQETWNKNIEHLLAYSEAKAMHVTSFCNIRPERTDIAAPPAITAQGPEWHPALKSVSDTLTPQYIIAAGAAWRGLIPRSQDTIVSLMEVGTEDTYEYQKISVLAEFLSASTVALSLLLSLLFVAAWLFMVNLQQQNAIQTPLLSIPSHTTNAGALQERTRALNHLVRETSQIIHSAPKWSKLLQALQERAIGVTITSFQFPETNAQLSLVGIAQTRADLNAFKKSISEIPYLDRVESPITHVYQKEAIPFTITFYLRDPDALGSTPTP